MTAAKALDPVTLEVIRSALTATAEEMSLVVMRAARSPLLREAGDLSSAVTDASGEMVAQGRDIPMHLGVMCFTVKEFLKRVPASSLRPGDVWFTNLPEVGGNHLPDVKAIRPVFIGGELAAFAVSLAHWADIGGAVPGSYCATATDIWQEGLRISPVRLFTAAGPERTTLDLVLANLRGAAEREGDIQAQMAATRAAEQRIAAIAAEHGLATFKSAMAALLESGERQMRDALARMPAGRYQGEDFLDDDGIDNRPIGIRVRIAFAPDQAVFDFTQSDDAAAGPVNTTPFIAAAAVFYAMQCLAPLALLPNGGALRPLKVITRPGSVLQPDPSRPVVGGNHETSQRIVDAIFRALEPVMAERLTAGGPTTSGLLLFGMRRGDGNWGTLYETHGGGEGARAERDGMPVVRVHMSNVMNTPAEVIEAEYPIEIVRHALRRGSGGAGAHRGGDGLVREYRMLADGISLTSMFERRVIPPYGLQGGEAGAAFRVSIIRADGSRFEIRGKQNLMLVKGDRVLLESCGGGGFGRAGPSITTTAPRME
ncbi:MAG TPA: hydantoinase B/oxoprolinase family protein [Alphaproteobacteria bacterium]|nr:hydantoinase B/oxoprolinase family protein [Alphaproteobacteria bacterium]